jgi:hypothetical protein
MVGSSGVLLKFAQKPALFPTAAATTWRGTNGNAVLKQLLLLETLCTFAVTHCKQRRCEVATSVGCVK